MWVKVFKFQTISQSWQWPDVDQTFFERCDLNSLLSQTLSARKAFSVGRGVKVNIRFSLSFIFIYLCIFRRFSLLICSIADFVRSHFVEMTFCLESAVVDCDPFCDRRETACLSRCSICIISAKTKQTAHANKQCCRRIFIPCDFFYHVKQLLPALSSVCFLLNR